MEFVPEKIRKACRAGRCADRADRDRIDLRRDVAQADLLHVAFLDSPAGHFWVNNRPFDMPIKSDDRRPWTTRRRTSQRNLQQVQARSRQGSVDT